MINPTPDFYQLQFGCNSHPTRQTVYFVDLFIPQAHPMSTGRELQKAGWTHCCTKFSVLNHFEGWDNWRKVYP